MKPGPSSISTVLTAQKLDVTERVRFAAPQIGNHRIIGNKTLHGLFGFGAAVKERGGIS